METKRLLKSDLLQPVQLRLDGLHERLTHLARTLAEVPYATSSRPRGTRKLMKNKSPDDGS
jgi:hypothetical protein